ncbi:MAG TPA: lipoyl(octanoyl) transferase LipB [Ignavibacteriaceae bacterium]|nr:lipoyl(octanoyl) transferase LipB [Ignavibacteriaceae bacterium]
MAKTLKYIDLNLLDYQEAWDLQKNIHQLRASNTVPDFLLLLEHPNTYTLGKTANSNNLISDKNYLDKNNISVYNIDRGGDITYHGPGQLVGYPIISLEDWKKDTHKYLRSIEEVIIKTLKEYNINAGRNPLYTGVWIENRKICAIGIKVSRWVTMHGFAFNVNTNLNLFKGIIPCGIKEENKDVTSLEKELGKHIELNEVKEIVLTKFKEEFGYDMVERLSYQDLILDI